MPGSSILSEGQSSQSGISYSSVSSQHLQSQVSCSQMQNDQTQQQHQQLSVVSVTSLLSLLLYTANVASFCAGQGKPQMQGVQSEAVPVTPNSQSAPAVSPQVHYCTCLWP